MYELFKKIMMTKVKSAVMPTGTISVDPFEHNKNKNSSFW